MHATSKTDTYRYWNKYNKVNLVGESFLKRMNRGYKNKIMQGSESTLER